MAKIEKEAENEAIALFSEQNNKTNNYSQILKCRKISDHDRSLHCKGTGMA
jgi:hypothetical protein